MNKRKFSFFVICVFVVSIILISIIFVSCTNKNSENEISLETTEIIIVVPKGNDIISQLISEYEKLHKNISVRLIDLGGTKDEIHRFCISTMIDNKFSADMVIADDVWLGEFISQGLVSEIQDFDADLFIPAVKNSVVVNNKLYGIPIYADGIVEYKKYVSDSDEVVYYEKSAFDILSHIRYQTAKGLTVSDVYSQYQKVSKCDSVDEFVKGNFNTMRSYLSSIDDMQKNFPKETMNIRIDMPNDTLIYSKIAMINEKSNVKEEVLDIIKYILNDESQYEIVRNMTIIPVMKKQYNDPVVIDKCPYIKGTDGMSFAAFPVLDNFNMVEENLKNANQSEVSEMIRVLKQ